MARAIRTTVGVPDLDRSVSFYQEADRLDSDDSVPAYPGDAENDSEVGPTLDEEPYDLGDGRGHPVVSVGDWGRSRAPRGCRLGAPKVAGPEKDGSVPGKFFVRDPDGYRNEVI